MVSITVMPKSRNLPMTTREPISDAKAREFLLPSSSWGSHHYRHSGYREEPQVWGYIAYIGSVHEKKEFLGRGMSDWSLSFEGLCVGFWLVPITQVDHKFLNVKSGDSGLGPIGSWVVGWGQGISKGSFPRTLQNGVSLLTKWSSLGSSIGGCGGVLRMLKMVRCWNQNVFTIKEISYMCFEKEYTT